MPFKTFGSLLYGEAFRFRGDDWIKVPLLEVDGVRINAFIPTGSTSPVTEDIIYKVDEMTLVETDTDIPPDRRLHFLKMFQGCRDN